ncbi:hypothetical protein GCM10027610_001520 [Dactylosporangium cerinum]
MELAAQNQIKVAVSNPCFELWLALHFADHRSFLSNTQARRLRRSHDGQSDKGLAGGKYMPNKKVAAQRAASLDRYHLGNGTSFPHNNPSSGMHQLLSAMLPASDEERD